MSAYKFAIDKTTRTIDTRARYFRNLIVAVVVLVLGSIGCAAVAWELRALTGALLLVPACGLFFFLDAGLLNRWRSYVLDAWVRKDIELRGLCDAVSAIPTLPKATVQSMLATLPDIRDLVIEQGISSSTRGTAAAAVTFIYTCESDIVAMKMMVASIVTASIVVAAIRLQWTPLLAVGTIVLPAILGMWLKRKRTLIWKRSGFALQAKADFSSEKCLQLIADLHVGPNWKAKINKLLTRS